jgi:muconolactone D-isomerase
VEFLLDIDVRLPHDLADAEVAELVAAERRRGRELMADHTLRHIWRVPGAMRNVSVWAAADATELHELVTSLPLYRYATVRVTPLATHPLNAPSGSLKARD